MILESTKQSNLSNYVEILKHLPACYHRPYPSALSLYVLLDARENKGTEEP